MAWFDSGEHLSGVSSEGVLLLSVGETFELGTREAGLFDVGVLADDVEFFGDSNGGLFSVTCDHNYIDTCFLAFVNGTFYFGSDGVLDAYVTYECVS